MRSWECLRVLQAKAGLEQGDATSASQPPRRKADCKRQQKTIIRIDGWEGWDVDDVQGSCANIYACKRDPQMLIWVNCTASARTTTGPPDDLPMENRGKPHRYCQSTGGVPIRTLGRRECHTAVASMTATGACHNGLRYKLNGVLVNVPRTGWPRRWS